MSNEAFVKPPEVLLGLTLRPYGFGTETLLDQVRLVLKSKLAGVFAGIQEESEKADVSARWFIAAFLCIHSADKHEVLKACWNPDLFFERLHDFMQRFTTKQILSAESEVARILKDARSAGDYTVESEGTDDPLSSIPARLPPTSGQSQD